MHATTDGHGENDHHFVGLGSVGYADFDRVVMTAHITPFEMRDRHVETGTYTGHFLGGRNDRRALAKCGPHATTTWDVPHRAVFDLTGRAHDGPFAVAVDHRRVAAEMADQDVAEPLAERAEFVGGG